jgi:hypothetical protein
VLQGRDAEGGIHREPAEDRSGTLSFAQDDRVGWIKYLRMSNTSLRTPGAF